MNFSRLAGVAVTIGLLTMVGACSSNTHHTGSSSTPPGGVSGTVSGAAAKGLLLNAPVSFYAVTGGVAGTTAIGTTRTNATTGAFSSTVTSSGPVVATVTTDDSTQMLDELSGTAGTAPSGLVLHAVFDSLTNLQPIAVTPLTEMAYQNALAASGGLTTTNIDAANNAVSTFFLGGAPALYTQPINLANYAGATVAEQAQAKLLTAFAVAASDGTATGASGNACTGTYAQELVCMIGGLGDLLTVNGGSIALGANAGYVSAAYAALDTDTVTVNGGQPPSTLGLDTATTAETSFDTAFQQQQPLPGFDAGADPLANTKALVANIRTNILDQATTQTFGYAPTLTALNNDVQQNVAPVVLDTSSLLGSAYLAAELLQFNQSGSSDGIVSSYLSNPYGIAADSSGNLYVSNPNTGNVVNGIISASGTITKIDTAGNVSVYAGQAAFQGVAETDGPAAQATFYDPRGLTVDAAGDVYVTDVDTVREITPDGTVSTLAGQFGHGGTTDGTGSAARFASPVALTEDGSGNLYLTDSGPTGISLRKIAPGAVVTTLIPAASECDTSPSCLGTDPAGIAADGAGNLYVIQYRLDIIQKVTPDGSVSTFAGQYGVSGDTDGTGTAAAFDEPVAITIDADGNLYVADEGNAAIREISPAGVVTTLAQTAQQRGVLDVNALGDLSGIAVGAGGGLYAANYHQNSVQQISAAGAVSTVVHGSANYQGKCGYDPAGLGTADNVALCRYGKNQNQMLLTLTQTGDGTYTVQTQPLAFSGAGGYNPVLGYYAVVSDTAPLEAEFNWNTGDSGAQSATFSGPYYVTAAGGQVTASLSAAESADWNAATGSGTITLGGSLSGGSGGVSLTSATIGSDTALVLQNAFAPGGTSLKNLLASNGPAVTISGTVDLTSLTTDAFSYAAKVTLGSPVSDKSGLVDAPGSIAITGSIGQVGADTTTTIFDGSVNVAVQGFSSYDVTQPISASNYFTTQAQVAGTLAFSGGRVLTVTAAANASQLTPTAAQPDSMSVTYSYATPSGTAQLNASGQYDTIHGYSGMITNNAGVVISVTEPVHGPLAGTITASGTATATIQGDFVYYSDDTSESLF